MSYKSRASYTSKDLEFDTTEDLRRMANKIHQVAGAYMSVGTAYEIEDLLTMADSIEAEISRRTGIPLR